MIKILRNKDFNITDFLVDNVEDVNELKNTNGCAAGSTAYIITTGETYIKKTNGDWIEKVETNDESNNTNDSNNGVTTVAVQADWMQNNPDEPDYIKNRIGGYTSTSYTTSSYKEETTCEFEPVEGKNYKYQCAFSMSSAVFGVTLEIVWDGAPYLCPCLDDGYGNVSLLDPTKGGHCNEPFVLFYNDGIMLATNDEGTHTVAVNIAGDYEEIITKIPERYLDLSNYAKTEDVPTVVQPDWNQSDENQPNYIKNKIGGYNYYSREESIVSEAQYTFTDNGEYYSLELTLPEHSTGFLDFVIDEISHMAGEDYGSAYQPYYETTSSDGKTSIYYDVDDNLLKIYDFEGESHTVEVITVEQHIRVVPMQYLPSGLATQEWVNNAIAEAIANLNTSA